MIDGSRNLYFMGSCTSDLGQNSNPGTWILKTTPRGTPLYSHFIGAYKSGDAVNGSQTQSAKLTRDGGMVLAGSLDDPDGLHIGTVTKMDAAQKIQWSVSLAQKLSTLRDVTELPDGSFIAVGRLDLGYSVDASGNVNFIAESKGILLKTDKAGNVLWWKSLSAAQYNDMQGVERLSDGNVAVVGYAGLAVGHYPTFILKVSSADGHVIWSNLIDIRLAGLNCIISEARNGNITVHCGNNVFLFDWTGKAILSTYIDLPAPYSSAYPAGSLSVTYLGSRNRQQFYSFDYSSLYFWIAAIENDSTTLWVRTYQNDRLKGNLNYARSGIVTDQSVFITAGFMDSNLDSLSHTGSYYFQTDINGKTPCSDTFSITPVIQHFPGTDGAVSFVNDNGLNPALQQNFVVQNLIPVRVLDCFTVSCCRDTVRYADEYFCEGKTATLPDGTTTGKAGLYTTAFHTHLGCDSVIYTSVHEVKNITVNLGTDTCLLSGQTLLYHLSYLDSVSLLWQDGTTSPNYAIRGPGTYWVRVASSCNTASDSIKVLATCDLPLYIPSAFTPNNDGLNDGFRIADMNGQQLVRLSIYNRYGIKVFETQDPSHYWDGTVKGRSAPSGVYVYLILYRDKAGEVHQRKGTVVVIR